MSLGRRYLFWCVIRVRKAPMSVQCEIVLNHITCPLPLYFEMGRSAHACTVRRQHNSATVRSMGNMREILSANDNALLGMKKNMNDRGRLSNEQRRRSDTANTMLWEQKHEFFGITTCVRLAWASIIIISNNSYTFVSLIE